MRFLRIDAVRDDEWQGQGNLRWVEPHSPTHSRGRRKLLLLRGRGLRGRYNRRLSSRACRCPPWNRSGLTTNSQHGRPAFLLVGTADGATARRLLHEEAGTGDPSRVLEVAQDDRIT